MNTVSDISSNFMAYFKTLTTPSMWDRQTIFLVGGVTLTIVALIFGWIAVGSVENVRSNTVSSYGLSAAPSLSDTKDAASAKNKTITTAILLTLGILLTLAGFPFAGGYMIGSI